MSLARPMRGPFWIEPGSPQPFPPVELALTDPDGLLAVGADLTPSRLLDAYRSGIFPWYSEGQPILWWSPDPRTVLFPEHLHISCSLHKTLRRDRFRVTADRAFRQVVVGCAAPRPGHDGTWITEAMAKAGAHAVSITLLSFSRRRESIAGIAVQIALVSVLYLKSEYYLIETVQIKEK